MNSSLSGQILLATDIAPYIFDLQTNDPPVMRRLSFNPKSIVMKKLATILFSAVMLVSVFAFATDSDKVNARVKASFLTDFSAATNVSWEKSSDFYFATFTINKV